MQSYKHIDSSNRLITFLLAFGPILNVYGVGIPGLSFANILFILIIAVSFLKNRNYQSTGFGGVVNTYLLYFMIMILTSLFNCMFSGYSLTPVIKRLMVYLFYIMMIYMFAGKKIIDGHYVFKVWKVLALIASVALLLQAVFHYAFGKEIFFLIPFFKYNQSTLADYSAYVNDYLLLYRYQFRPSSIFLEPSHFALFTAPIVSLILNKETIDRKEFAIAGIISIAIIFSTSGTGYVLLFISWLNLVLKILRNRKVEIRKVLFFVTALIIGVYIVLNNEYLPTLLKRMTSINNGETSSINARLVKGFQFFGMMNPIEKIFGIGCGTYEHYIAAHSGLDSRYAFEYMNSISDYLVTTGVVGFSIICYMLIKMKTYFAHSDMSVMFWIILAMYFTGSVSFSWYDCLPIIATVAIIESNKMGENYE